MFTGQCSVGASDHNFLMIATLIVYFSLQNSVVHAQVIEEDSWVRPGLWFDKEDTMKRDRVKELGWWQEKNEMMYHGI